MNKLVAVIAVLSVAALALSLWKSREYAKEPEAPPATPAAAQP